MSSVVFIAIVATTIWLCVLSSVVVLLVRQIGLITIRLDLALQHAAADLVNDGPPVGHPLTAAVTAIIPELRTGSAFLLLVAANCSSCRGLVANLHGKQFVTSHRLIAMIPGTESLAEDLQALLPDEFETVRDPTATNLAAALNITSTPFILDVENGAVRRKMHLHAPADFYLFISPAASNPQTADLDSLAQTSEVMAHVS